MLPPAVRIYVAAEPVDLRRGVDGLAAATRDVIRLDPLFCDGPRSVACDVPCLRSSQMLLD
jgi:hypothetical protein